MLIHYYNYYILERCMILSKEPDPWTKPDVDRPWPEDDDDEEED